MRHKLGPMCQLGFQGGLSQIKIKNKIETKMINTLSLCPTCYKKIEAHITFQSGLVIMTKVCPEHGPFTSVVEKDIQHFSNFYSEGSLGNNNAIIIHTNDSCNMSCPWCYYPTKQINPHKPFSYYDTVLGQYRGYNLLMSGGEPTLRPDFFQFTEEGTAKGWSMAAITNMLTMADPEFFEKVLGSSLTVGNMMKFAMSMQHPKNYPKEVLEKKMMAAMSLESHGKQAMCAMFSIQSIDELDYIRNWKNKGTEDKLWLSDLHKAFLYKFSDLMPKISLRTEKSNIYCLYLEMSDGMQVSLSSAPTVENLDYHQCSRPVMMLAEDGKCYPVPICQIVSEGLEKGYKDGYKLQGDKSCGL
jgi:organic radical activating enzyme